jgi:hypothetical protein
MLSIEVVEVEGFTAEVAAAFTVVVALAVVSVVAAILEAVAM